MKLLEKKPSDRFESAEALKKALEPLLLEMGASLDELPTRIRSEESSSSGLPKRSVPRALLPMIILGSALGIALAVQSVVGDDPEAPRSPPPVNEVRGPAAIAKPRPPEPSRPPPRDAPKAEARKPEPTLVRAPNRTRRRRSAPTQPPAKSAPVVNEATLRDRLRRFLDALREASPNLDPQTATKLEERYFELRARLKTKQVLPADTRATISRELDAMRRELELSRAPPGPKPNR
jgi:outer membrane biosynthesis protein TonB